MPQSVIFCNSRNKVVWLHEQIQAKNISVSYLHSSMNDVERSTVLNSFFMGSSRILLLNDCPVVDLQSIPLVLNYDLPSNINNYVFRVHCNRYNKKTVINFVTNESKGVLIEIENIYNTNIEEMPANIAEYL